MWSINVNRFELGTFSTKFKWGHAFDGLTVMSVSLLEWRIMGPWLFHYITLSWTWCDGGSEKQQEWKARGTPKAKPEAFVSILFANVPLAKKKKSNGQCGYWGLWKRLHMLSHCKGINTGKKYYEVLEIVPKLIRTSILTAIIIPGTEVLKCSKVKK